MEEALRVRNLIEVEMEEVSSWFYIIYVLVFIYIYIYIIHIYKILYIDKVIISWIVNITN